MERALLAKFREWRVQACKKNHPLVVRGARRVGKTWLLQSFGDSDFENVIYCNFEDDFVIGNLFSTASRAENLLMVLEEKYQSQSMKILCSYWMKYRFVLEVLPEQRSFARRFRLCA